MGSNIPTLPRKRRHVVHLTTAKIHLMIKLQNSKESTHVGIKYLYTSHDNILL